MALPSVPRVVVVLGSGLGHLTERLADPVSIRFGDVPGLPPSSIDGHAGRYVHGTLDGTDVLVQAGRYHAYEGYPLQVVVAPIRIAAELGVEIVVFTNAAGGIHAGIGPGHLVLLDDHVNVMCRSPLMGPVVGGEERFPDMSAPYDSELQAAARRAAAKVGIDLVRGTYAAVLGPSYETAAEVRMLRRLGADVVGMSTVPEVITARALGIRCVGFSLVTNRATGLGAGPIAHADVLEIGKTAGARLARVLVALVGELAAYTQSTTTK